MTSPETGADAGRTVVVFRHAHAQISAPGGDHERQLDGRGRREAAAAGQWLAGLDLHIDLVLCSTATRAQQTWAAAAAALDPQPPVSPESRIYDGGVEDLLQLVNDASARTLVLVGHNPTVTSLVRELDPEFEGELRTASLAVVELAEESGAGTGRVTASWTPEKH